jgi:hypothetical protein
MPKLGTILASLLLTVTPASALTLTTPMGAANDGQLADCIVTNIGTGTIRVSIELVNELGAVLTADNDTCAGNPVAARQSCQAFVRNAQYYCVVTTNSRKVRAGIAIFDPSTNRMNTYLPATK